MGVRHRDQKMEVVGEEGETVDVDWVETPSPGEDAYDDSVESTRRLEQEPAVDGTAGDFDQCTALRNEAKSSCHTSKDATKDSDLAQVGGTFPGRPRLYATWHGVLTGYRWLE